MRRKRSLWQTLKLGWYNIPDEVLGMGIGILLAVALSWLALRYDIRVTR